MKSNRVELKSNQQSSRFLGYLGPIYEFLNLAINLVKTHIKKSVFFNGRTTKRVGGGGNPPDH